MVQQIIATVGAQLVIRLQSPSKRPDSETPVVQNGVVKVGESKSVDKKGSKLQRSVLARCGPLARALGRHKRGSDGQPLMNPEAREKRTGGAQSWGSRLFTHGW